MARLVKKLLRRSGIDRAVGYTLVGQAFSQLFRPITLVLMVACLTVEEQGYQYAIVGLVSVRVFFEMGFGAVILHFVGYEAGHLAVVRGRGPGGSPEALARVASIFRQTARVYAALAVLFVATVLPGGWWMLSRADDAGAVAWQGPWVLAGVQAAAQFPVGMSINLLAGCNLAVPVARLRLIAGLVQTVTYAGLLLGGAGLYSAPIAGLLALGTELVVVGVGYGPFLAGLWRYPVGAGGVGWWREVWPFQWRIALSGMSSYILSQALVPVAFALFGSVASARLGLTLGCTALLQGVVWSWIGVRFPVFAALVGTGEYAELDRRFGRALRSSVVMYLIAAATAVAATAAVGRLGLAVADRLLPPELVAVSLATGLCWHLTDCMAGYFQVHRRDPFVWVKLGSALVLPGAAYLAGLAFGVPGMVAAMFLTGVGVGAGAGGLLFRRHRRTWQPAERDFAPGVGTATPIGGGV